jgi:MFS family permease
MFQLINWLILRLRFFYYLPSDFGLPTWTGNILAGAVILLFMWALYDLYKFHNRGAYALFWLGVILIVPLGSVLYLLIGSKQLRSLPTPILKKSPVTNQVTTSQQPKVYAPQTQPANKAIIKGGLVVMLAMVGILVIINSIGMETTTYDAASHYDSIAGAVGFVLAIFVGAWMAYVIAHPRKIKQRSSFMRVFLTIIGFIFGFIPGVILAAVITYPLSDHACRLSGSKYC